MWQLLGFGEVDTPGRRYAIVDNNGRVRWTGETVADAQVYILNHGLVPSLERNAAGAHFVRESPSSRDPSHNNLEHGHGPWGGAGE